MKLFTCSLPCFSGGVLAAQDAAQNHLPQPKPNMSAQSASSVDRCRRQASKLKTDKGRSRVPVQDQTGFLRSFPAKPVWQSYRIELKDIGVGERVLARTRPSEAGPTAAVRHRDDQGPTSRDFS